MGRGSMKPLRIHWLALLLAGIMLCAVFLPSTLAYITASTTQIINSFLPDPLVLQDQQAIIRIKKIISNHGSASIGPEGFLFELVDLDTQEKRTVRTDASGNAEFLLDYTIADKGIHRYQLREVDEGKENIVYSTLTYAVQVTVAVTEDDRLTAEMTVNGQREGQQYIAAFENVYHAVDLPDTGDGSRLGLHLATLLFSMVSLGLILGRKKKRIG